MFTQEAARKQITETPGGRGVDQHQIEIALETPMLKTVIEDQNLAVQFFNSHSGQRQPVGSLEMRHIGQVFLEHQCLVIASISGSVTAAHQGNPALQIPIKAGDIFDAGCFARSPERQVADADHGDGNRIRFLPAAIEQEVAAARHPAIRNTENSQAQALQRGPGAASISTNQRKKVFFQGGPLTGSVPRQEAVANTGVPVWQQSPNSGDGFIARIRFCCQSRSEKDSRRATGQEAHLCSEMRGLESDPDDLRTRDKWRNWLACV